jgi:hypothetical protein
MAGSTEFGPFDMPGTRERNKGRRERRKTDRFNRRVEKNIDASGLTEAEKKQLKYLNRMNAEHIMLTPEQEGMRDELIARAKSTPKPEPVREGGFDRAWEYFTDPWALNVVKPTLREPEEQVYDPEREQFVPRSKWERSRRRGNE